MNKLILLIFTLILCSCNPSQVQKPEALSAEISKESTATAESATVTAVAESQLIETGDEYAETATYYVLVADTSTNYYVLRDKMFAIHEASNAAIDTLGRTYFKEKDLIALPEDDEDEIYAGNYYHRRFPSKSLSLEYLDSYQDSSGAKTIALVTGIYEQKSSADSALVILKESNPKAFVVQTEMYVGCIH